jgi:hypothetical protein
MVGEVERAVRVEQLFAGVFERRGGDYQTLLAYGRVWRDSSRTATSGAR